MSAETPAPEALTLRAYARTLGALPELKEILDTLQLTAQQAKALRGIVDSVEVAEQAWQDRIFGQG